MYFVMSLVTMRAPAALTWNFLKCSRRYVRTPMAISVRKDTRFEDGARAARARDRSRTRKVYIDRHVYKNS